MMTSLNRRKFIRTASALTVGATSMMSFSHAKGTVETSVFVIGPQAGYAPQIGTLVSMLNYNRYTIVNMVKSMSQTELDYLHDAKANTIGSLILHLGATEKFYQINTFEGRQDFNEQEKKIWGAAMSLGDEGREKIKGHDAKYYLDMIDEVRKKTLAALKEKNDEWLLAIDPAWSKERPLNTYWKWFHVCEHEANHRGQIAWLRSRLPGAKAGTD